ncbi:MAG: BBP7 family outer membrane beta-barrel protein [Gemmatales bacterium]|nr:BBP7 family outer membrane beta-barrel protein [Gemmatales bacterium]MDW8222511.1 BBP7 family outer membrane beta-barrel protein [Gemmatales bacterium]
MQPACFWPYHPHPVLRHPATPPAAPIAVEPPLLVSPPSPGVLFTPTVAVADGCDVAKIYCPSSVVCEPCPELCSSVVTPLCAPCDPCAYGAWNWGWANCPPADYRGAPYVFYADLEYLIWWMKSMSIPPLITTSNANDLGVLGRPSTQVLLGESLDHDAFSGGRFTLGWWFDPCRVWAIEGTFFFLAEETRRDLFSSSGIPILARPFFNAQTGQEDSELIANPSLPGLFPLAGQAEVTLESRLIGFELNLVRSWLYGANPAWHKQYNLDFVFGYRYMQLRETLTIREDLLVPEDSGDIPAGTRFLIEDAFATRNSFNGGQIGLRGELRWGSWFLDGRAKVAFGNTSQTVTINGSTVIVTPGTGTISGPGGLLALPTNMGRFQRDTFSVVPEFGVNVGYYITPYIKVYVGYTFLGWTNVVRPGNVIDRQVNPSQLPPGGILVGPARPAFRFRDGDFWVQGVNVGVEMRY